MKQRNATAVLVIHGIDEQLPFQTLDEFTSTLWNVMEQRNDTSLLPGHHCIVQRQGWIENYISLESGARANSTVDVYEYYWAYKAERHVALGDIVEWLIATSDGAQKYYKENEKLAETYEGTGVKAFSKKTFKKRWYLKQLGWLMRVLSFVPSVLSTWIAHNLSWLIMVLNPVMQWVEQQMIDYIGDVVIYTSADKRSKFYEVRADILNGAVDELTALLNDPKYTQVIVAGHSLGTVIAFDALNRINHEMNTGTVDRKLARKITGFVTFGSPLDKIAFFFREHTPNEEYLRRQILNHYHSFKAKPLTEQPNPKELSNPFLPLLDHVYWINFWDPEDKVSGQLDFYRVDKNIQLALEKNVLSAHTAYWQHQEMYRIILDRWKI
ncbi:MAG: hypothetical protein PHP42_08890 [Bacteroidota bacterium]|nr:hypothetical protein [Bacteroidota bacterium]